MSPSAILSAAADLLDKPGAWTQGAQARDVNHHECAPVATRAVCWCVMGAINKFADHTTGAGSVAMEAVRDQIDEGRSVSAWNDRAWRTQAEVVAALRRAAAL